MLVLIPTLALAQFDTSFLVLTPDSTMDHVKAHRALSDRTFKRSRLGEVVETGEGDCPEQRIPMPTGKGATHPRSIVPPLAQDVAKQLKEMASKKQKADRDRERRKEKDFKF